MNKETKLSILHQIDTLITSSNQLYGMVQCLDVLSEKYDPGDDIAFVAESTGKITAEINDVVRALEDILTKEAESGKE